MRYQIPAKFRSPSLSGPSSSSSLPPLNIPPINWEDPTVVPMPVLPKKKSVRRKFDSILPKRKGVQFYVCRALLILWIPAFTGMTLMMTALTQPVQAEPLTAAAVARQNASGANAGSISPSGRADNLLFTGTFHYSHPLRISPGIAGMQPNLALSYNSSQSNSWMGAGWDLSLGSIRRSTKDGVPNYDSSDKFIMTYKGQSQELAKMADGFYRVKIEGAFHKITLDAGGWAVYHKSGLISYFGRFPASRLDTPNGTYLWALDKVVDRNENYMEVVYTRPGNANQIYPATIHYTGNHLNNRQPDKEIRFYLEEIPKTYYDYSAGYGYTITMQHRLTNVRSYVGNTLVWDHVFHYNTSQNTNKSLLEEIRSYGTDGVSSFPVQTFTYQGSDDPYNLSASIPLPSGGWGYNNQNVLVGDFNGDGKQDYARYRLGTTQGHGSDIYFSDGGGAFHWVGEIPGGNYENGNQRAQTGDFNGDGKTDFVTYAFGGGNAYGSIHLSNGNGTFAPAIGITGVDFSQDPGFLITGNFDDDGITDIVTYSHAPIPESNVLTSDGDGTFTYRGPLPPGRWSSPNTVVFPADFNGDRKSDLVMYRNGIASNDSEIWFNTGGGGFLYQGQVPGSNFSSSFNQVAAADLNGDNLSDLVVWSDVPQSYGDGAAVYLSQGQGAFDRTYVMLYNNDISNTAENAGIRFGDVNGDGFNDIVLFQAGGPSHGSRIYINNGTGTFYEHGPIPENDFYPVENGVVMADFTGDGRADIVDYRWGGHQPRGSIHLSNNVFPDLMVNIKNGIGGETRVQYRLSTDYTNELLPFATQVVSEILHWDGQCVVNYNDCLKTTYDYEGGLFDLLEREFLGFNKVTTLDAMNNKTVTYFHQKKNQYGEDVPENAMKGRIYKVETFDAAGTLLRARHTPWTHSKLAPKRVFAYPTHTTSIDYEETPAFQTEQHYSYNITTGYIEQTYFTGDVNAAGDEKTVETVYANVDIPGTYLIGFPQEKRIWSARGNVVSESRHYYDESQTLGIISRGNMTETQQFLDKPTPKWVSTTMEYNVFGQVTAVTDPKQHRTETTYDANGYPIQVTNPVNHTVTSTFDHDTGFLLTTTDANNQTTAIQYDGLGRTAKVIGPLDSATYPSVEYDYHDELRGDPGSQHVEKFVREQHGQPGTLWSQTFIDGLGRQWLSKTETDGGRSLITFTRRNNRGQVTQVSVPRFNDDPNPEKWFITDYDALGRVIESRNPDNTSTFTIYNGRTTYVQDANGKTHTSVTDAYGRIIRRHEPGIANPTEYHYDAMGLLFRLTDSQGHDTHFSYDFFGRKLTLTDPNAGSWVYVYDDNGNLIEQRDARGVKITFQYDELDRLLEKKLTADPLNVSEHPVGTVLASYIYDETVNRPYSIGALTTADDLYSTSRFYHDELGQAIRQTKEVDGTIYETETEFDALGRPTRLIYPNDEEVLYSYDSGGHLQQITNGDGSHEYAAYNNFDELGRPLEVEQSNSATNTSYSYDPLKQTLNNLQIETLESGSPVEILNLTHSFDNVGNLLTINDNQDPGYNQTFDYDDLYRMKNAQGVYGAMQYSYDDLGNFSAKGDDTYLYEDPNHPYAVTTIQSPSGGSGPMNPGGPPASADTTFTYDANGNCVSKITPDKSWTYSFEAEGRLKWVRESGNLIATYEYDGAGGRVKKTTSEGTTLYIGKLFEIRPDGSQVNHIFAGGQPVADLVIPDEGAGSGGGEPGHPEGGGHPPAGGGVQIYNYHLNHLGSVAHVTDSHGTPLQELTYMPFGEIYENDGTSPVHHKYTSQEDDNEVDLYFYNARYYDPAVGRFMSADTIVQSPIDPQSLNRYAYVRNNPGIYTDPSGYLRISLSFHAIVGGHISFDSDNGHMRAGVGVGIGGGFSVGDDNWDIGYSNGQYLDVGYDNKAKSSYITGQYGNGFQGPNGASHGWGASGTYFFKHDKYIAGGGVGYYGFGVSSGYSSFGEGSWTTGGSIFGLGASYNHGSKEWHYSGNPEEWRRLHYLRNNRNKPPATAEEAETQGWKSMKEKKSVFHRMGPGGKGNIKYISPNGRHEAVYNNGALVTDHANMGTYNVVPPRSFGYVGHAILDVVPYLLFGNSHMDPTNIINRISQTYDGPVK